MLASIGLFVAAQDATPYTLPIGRPGTSIVESGRITSLPAGTPASPDDVAKAADGKQFVFLGEQHATAPHQAMQASLIEALVRRGRHVVVGLEMFQRPKQSFLDDFVAGKLSESDFLSSADWKGQWGYDFSYYRPVFDAARRHKLPILGLNVPRDWVRAVGRGGLAGLPEEAKPQLPAPWETNVPEHRKVFESLMGGHPVEGPQMENMLAAQTLWDVGMADTAAKYLEGHKRDRKLVIVIIAGSGHVMYGQGINLRLANRGLDKGITLVMTESSTPMSVSNGLGDFVYVSPEPRKATQ